VPRLSNTRATRELRISVRRTQPWSESRVRNPQRDKYLQAGPRLAFWLLSCNLFRASLRTGLFTLTDLRKDAQRRSKNGGPLRQLGAIASATEDRTCIEKLARLFPSASPVRLPVRVITLATGRQSLQEQTIIEFGTSQEVLFSSTLPLEFEDRVRVVNSDGSLDANAKVVAVRYHDGAKAVAARFVGQVENWIIKP
jgi:hypothetical protein